MDPSSSGGSPTSPVAASPAPAKPSPQMQSGTQDVLKVVELLRGIAKSYPKAAPFVSQINDLMPKVMSALMEDAQPGEPAAPPTAG